MKKMGRPAAAKRGALRALFQGQKKVSKGYDSLVMCHVSCVTFPAVPE